jgi:hypothetical protein
MNEEEFSELSAKVLVGDASSEEHEMHKSACEQNADFKASFEEMKVASGILKENAPLASSMDAKEPQIPEFLLEKLVGEVEHKEASNEHKSHESVNSKSNLTSFFKYAAMPLAAAFAFALYINKGSEPTSGLPTSYELASMGVQFGSWQEGVVRGGDESDDWLPSAIKPAFYNNKKERAEWIQAQSESIRVWIDEDEAKIMIFRPWADAPSSIELLPDSAGQRDQLIQLLNQLSFPPNGVKYVVSEQDSLESISNLLKSQSEWIIHANGLDPNLPLEQGSTLFVPQAD